MSTTAREIIKSALKLVGVVAGGETPSAEEQSDGFKVLQLMLDTWSTESLSIYKQTREPFTLTGASSYTMGPAAQFATTRPVRILGATTLDTTSSPNQEIPIEIINLDQWRALSQKSLTSTIATKLYVDTTYPTLTLYFWPVPTAVNQVVIYSEKPLVDPVLVDDVIDLPPGYEMAMRYSLAVLLFTEYGRPVDQSVAAIASTTKGNIERMNIKPLYMTCDPAIVSRGAIWDWRTGE